METRYFVNYYSQNNEFPHVLRLALSSLKFEKGKGNRDLAGTE